MGAKAYTTQQKLEAIALGRVMGAESAGKQLHVDPRTIVKWMRDAGDPPIIEGTQHQWRQQFDVAHARLMERLTGPRVTVAELATAKGIAERNLRDAPPPPEPVSDVEQWGDDLERRLDQAYGKDADLALVTALEWLDTLTEAPSVDAVLAHLASIPDLHAWRAARDAERGQAVLDQLERNRAIADEWALKALDDETQALLAAAE